MHRVLAIDDDEAVRDVLTTFLRSNDYEIAVAENGEAGLELIRDILK